jgi:hypothetical protein
MARRGRRVCRRGGAATPLSSHYITIFLATANGQALVKTYVRIKKAATRRSIVACSMQLPLEIQALE